MEQKLHNFRFASDFLDMTPKAQATKVKVDKLNFLKILNFLSRHYSQSKKATHRLK